MLRAALAGAATLLLLFVAALTTTTGVIPSRGQVVSASPQVVSTVPKAPEALPSATATAAATASPKGGDAQRSPTSRPTQEQAKSREQRSGPQAVIAASPPGAVAPPVVRSVTNSPLTVNGSGTGNSGVALTVRSTAYCESGLMASGAFTYWGAVAMAEPFGSRWLVLSGPLAGQVFTAADRYGWGTQFDVAMPGECGRARVYGLRIIQVVRVG